MKLPQLKSHHIQVQRTARYFTIGEISEQVSDVWIALHGYGQTASDFAKPFRPHGSSESLFIFPEGLSRFYNRNREHKIGASWMTSEDRKSEIRDYVAFLSQVHDEVAAAGLPTDIRMSVLGFSQGTATASRWLAAQDGIASRLILWGGLPAEELLKANFAERISGTEIILVTGKDDKFAPPEKVHQAAHLISSTPQPAKTVIFEGGHEIDSATLAELM